MATRKPITPGEVFGRLTALTHGVIKGKYRKVLCRCSCGVEREFQEHHLKSGATRSCGCMSAELSRERWLKHGHARIGRQTPEYRTWSGIVHRCENPKATSYPWYGGRGIKICTRWRHGENEKSGFECFVEDMGPKPHNMTIERDDSDGDYCPGNCRWATWAEQGKSRSNVTKITFDGETLAMSDWAARLGLSAKTIHRRLALGWTIERALTTSVPGAPVSVNVQEIQ